MILDRALFKGPLEGPNLDGLWTDYSTKGWEGLTSGQQTAVVVLGLLDTASMAASAYHGYKRNDSVGWAIWWGFMGSLFPVLTPVIGLAQGFGQPKKTRR